jgi:cobalt/nickel transport system permease protein
MHISEGVLSPAILAGGALIGMSGVYIGLKNMDQDDIPATGILSAAFFVASLVHVPVGPASVHLVLNGLLGFILGWKAFPAIFTGLVLHALLFQFGGITTLGINTLNLALPAISCYYLFGRCVKKSKSRSLLIIASFTSGFFAVLFSGILVAFSLYLTGEAFLPAAKLAVVVHVPLMFIEGGITAACVMFLKKVKPELLEGSHEHVQ